MIVLDASAAIEWLLKTPTGLRVARRISSRRHTLHAPHLLDVEVTQVLRRYVTAGTVPASRAQEALKTSVIFGFVAIRTLRRIWELRDNLTAYDAVYVALAKALDATLVTGDGKLALATGYFV